MSRSVKTTYRKAGSSPSTRQKPAESLTGGISRSTSPLASLTRYITENEGSGIPREELIEQFRELDCEHSVQHIISESNTKRVYACIGCGLMTTVQKAAK